MALIDRVHCLNRALPKRAYFRLLVNDSPVGFVDTQLLAELDPLIFIVYETKQQVHIRFGRNEREDFEKTINDFFRNYFAKHNLSGWRDELYAVSESFNSPCLFLLERAALSYLGITGYGVHINGYIEKPEGLFMWVAKRSLNKATSPGKLDQIAAGGQPYGISLIENVIKECEEEASIPRYLAQGALPVSAMSYCYDLLPIGLRPDVMFNYDLKLPNDFTPKVNDDEVESFQLYPIRELLQRINDTEDFKFNSAVGIIDFGIRHGIISPTHSDYLRIQEGMNQREQRFSTLCQLN